MRDHSEDDNRLVTICGCGRRHLKGWRRCVFCAVRGGGLRLRCCHLRDARSVRTDDTAERVGA